MILDMFEPDRPDSSEYPPFYQTYVSLVPSGSVIGTLELGGHETSDRLSRLTDAQAAYSYAPGKWTVKQVLGHMTDTERIFAYRLLRIARGDTTPLPGFEQNLFVETWDIAQIPMLSLLAEWDAVRISTLRLLYHLSERDWTRQGVANGGEVTVRALAFAIAGHEIHHRGILERQYHIAF